MAKKYFGQKNQFANMPQEVKHTTYPKRKSMSSNGYCDTQPELDMEFNKAVSKMKKISKK